MEKFDYEAAVLCEFAQKSKDTRGRDVFVPPCSLRTEYQRDRDKIIHSKAFRRLKHKTQVFFSPEGDHYRTRLTHTLEVSQIARTIARSLRLNEDLVEAIALGHDLGHTPFGHSGERLLQTLAPPFYHNEQSLRVVEFLENNGEGLNLTFEVKDGILHHKIDGNPCTLEGKVVSYADRIAYINHDIDDAIRAGLLTETALPTHCTKVLGVSKSQRINTLVCSIVENSFGKNKVAPDAQCEIAMNDLRQFMFDSVYSNPIAKGEESKSTKMLEMIFEYYLNNINKLPLFYIALLNKYDARRVVSDFIASMTDRFAVNLFENLFVPFAWKKY